MSKKPTHSILPDPLDRYRRLLGEVEFAALLAALQLPLPQALRMNPLKVDPWAAMAQLAVRYGWEIQPVAFCPSGWQVISAQTPPSQTIEFALGQYYIQDAASMLPAELFDFTGLDAPLVLDLAAAPGGKTTHLISRAGDRGLVVGNDSSPGRAAAMRGVLRDWGAVNAAVTSFAGEFFSIWFTETFDRVLLDAPCSMENLRPARGHGTRPTTPRERESLSQRQLRLLASALQAVKVGGQVVYSTCTLAPEEDERVLDGLLKLYKNAVEIIEPPGRFPRAPGLAADETNRYDPAVTRALRLYPHTYGTSGFFAALLRKTAPVPGPSELPPSRPLEKLGWARLTARETRDIAAFFLDEYGFDLLALLERQDLSLWRRGEGVHALPELYFRALGGVKVEGLGLLLAEETPQGLQISHEWAARFGGQFQRGVVTLPAGLVAGWLRGEDVPLAEVNARGKTVLVKDEDGRLLGRGKVQAQRLKNLLPRRLV